MGLGATGNTTVAMAGRMNTLAGEPRITATTVAAILAAATQVSAPQRVTGEDPSRAAVRRAKEVKAPVELGEQERLVPEAAPPRTTAWSGSGRARQSI